MITHTRSVEPSQRPCNTSGKTAHGYTIATRGACYARGILNFLNRYCRMSIYLYFVPYWTTRVTPALVFIDEPITNSTRAIYFAAA